ncbi:TPA: hypothetical protein QDB06_000801 [Burkholderia vietnamiensis]|nr:hypothetical protein [Burkholderia vietnamiensis]
MSRYYDELLETQLQLEAQLRYLKQDSLKYEIIKSFGPILNANEHEIPHEKTVYITEIKDGIAYSPESACFMFFVYGASEDVTVDTMVMVNTMILESRYFDDDMYYWGKSPHDGIEIEEYKQWFEEQRSGNPDVFKAVKDMEKYVLNYKLNRDLAMKGNEQTKKPINDPMSLRDEPASLNNGAARTKSNKIKI